MGLHGVAACLSRRNSDGIVTRIDRLRYQLRYRNKKDYVFYGLWDCMVVDMFRSLSETMAEEKFESYVFDCGLGMFCFAKLHSFPKENI